MTKTFEMLFKGLSLREIEEILFSNPENTAKKPGLQPVKAMSYSPYRRRSGRFVEQKVYIKS